MGLMREKEQIKSTFLTEQKMIPGGVNSPVRSFSAVSSSLIHCQKIKGFAYS